MPALKTLKNYSENLSGKTILYRAPYDIETEKNEAGEFVIKDDSRIKCTLETLKYLAEKDCKITILIWVGRPEAPSLEFSTIHHAKKLSELLGMPVKHVNDCHGAQVQQEISSLKNGEILMLENTRFHKEELEDNDAFAQELCKGRDLIVFDAFPQAHRKHSSTTGILRHLPSVAGFYFEKEYTSLAGIIQSPEKPFTVIIGGAKTSDKIDSIKNLAPIADQILTAGGVANVFLKAQGKNLGNSFIEAISIENPNKEKIDIVEYAKQILMQFPDKIKVPTDLIIGKDPKNDAIFQVIPATQDIPQDMGAYDIGPETSQNYGQIISNSKTIFWAGPIGIYEKQNYSHGTMGIVKALCESKENTIVAGGDTIDALNNFGDPEKIRHISLAGGATLEFVAGKELPVLKYLISQ